MSRPNPKDGVMVRSRKCPKCGKTLMANAVGAEWCTDCNYYVRNGVQVNVKKINHL